MIIIMMIMIITIEDNNIYRLRGSDFPLDRSASTLNESVDDYSDDENNRRLDDISSLRQTLSDVTLDD